MTEHKRCPFCGSNNIVEVKPQWGLCPDCEGNFHMIVLKSDDERSYATEGLRS